MRRFAGFSVMLMAVACATQRKDPDSSPAVSKARPEVIPPIAFEASGELPESMSRDVTWQLAERGDPMNLATLAQRLGGLRLAELIAEGGRAGAIALDAFEYAPDALAERGRLCDLLGRMAPPFRERGLRVLERVVQQAPLGEVIDPSADSRCRIALGSASRRELDLTERDLLDSVQRRLAPE
jgi:hypothetical protein